VIRSAGAQARLLMTLAPIGLWQSHGVTGAVSQGPHSPASLCLHGIMWPSTFAWVCARERLSGTLGFGHILFV
jgi:hypothetical protein